MEHTEKNLIHENLQKRKAQGSMLGLAIGDALGAPVEFLFRDRFEPVSGYRGGGKFDVQPGEYTDDTAMALSLAQSLIDCNGTDQYDQLRKYSAWFDEGYMSAAGRSIGCGKTVLRALMRFKAHQCSECGNTRLKKGAGNGSLMRIAPVAIYYRHSLKTAMEMAAKSSYTTHGLKVCADACMLYTGLIVGALHGMSKETLLARNYFAVLQSLLPAYRFEPEVCEVMEGSYKTKSRDAIKSGGYVIDTMEAALWAFYHTESFDRGVLQAVNLGHDADTVGAVYGQLAGAFYGIEGIGEVYVDGLIKRGEIKEISDRLFLKGLQQ